VVASAEAVDSVVVLAASVCCPSTCCLEVAIDKARELGWIVET